MAFVCSCKIKKRIFAGGKLCSRCFCASDMIRELQGRKSALEEAWVKILSWTPSLSTFSIFNSLALLLVSTDSFEQAYKYTTSVIQQQKLHFCVTVVEMCLECFRSGAFPIDSKCRNWFNINSYKTNSADPMTASLLPTFLFHVCDSFVMLPFLLFST